ncbi:MAG: dethiobiotin synthase [Leptospirillia bacterium]
MPSVNFFPPDNPKDPDNPGNKGCPSVLFVLATDTGVGKTRVMESIVRQNAGGAGVFFVKAVQTGEEPIDAPGRSGKGGQEDERDLFRYLKAGALASAVWEGASFRAPLDPMTAARLEGRRVDREALAFRVRTEALAGRKVVVEGSGGVLSPFFEDGSGILSLARALSLPIRVLLVSHPHLGTLSGTLSAVRILILEGFPPEALLLCPRPGVADLASRSNPRTLAALLPALPVHLLGDNGEWERIA